MAEHEHRAVLPPPPRPSRLHERPAPSEAGPYRAGRPHDAVSVLGLQRRVGNAGVTRLVQRQAPVPAPAPAAPAVARTELERRFNGNYEIAAQAVKGLWDSAGGVIARQQQAVIDFTGPGGAATNAQPSFTEDVVVGALETALGLALGGVGGAITSRLGRTIRAAALAGAIQGEVSGRAPAELAVAAGILAQKYVSQIVEHGQGKVKTYVSSAVRGNLPQATPLAQFGRGQQDTLNEVSITQGELLLERIANAPAEERWIVAQGLYDALRESLNAAYLAQRDSMTDVWFTSQVTSVGLGARPGVLNIELEDVYADHSGPLRITGGNLLGAGNNDAVRGWVAGRPLEDIGIPKVITMNGSLGWGVLDCIFTIKLWSPQAPATGPTIGPATPSPLRLYMAGGPQEVTEVGGNRWGPTWLAAYHHGLQDLDNDDDRVTRDAVWAGARKVWDNVKGRSVTSFSSSVDASSW
ncbi:hypothetical protein M3148_02330 [Georgenia satyanarayanai]|uniref:hypothetical protein n=1 Tax=Georgenia satyanarayanai TaxID=860221 RepID=UPI00203D05BF|nr:hypothetical protein [Georgenia satyanarayanai]MCM3659838.1 hypothetical protein [Georgenia satyanarayanai]